MSGKRYPRIFIRSKNELAKHLSHSSYTQAQALSLINDVLVNFDYYWCDNFKRSESGKNKYVRDAKGSPLGLLLGKINQMVLSPYDYLLPDFIFGGINGKDHVMAAEYLLGKKRKRVALKMDILRFFEQISEERVFHFFRNKCGCSDKAARLLARLCCVPTGPKGGGSNHATIARGFATSSRLAVWCNLDTFLKLSYFIKKRLKPHDPRIAIYVDDIGITASRVSKDEMQKVADEVKVLLESDKNQKLPVNDQKTKVTSHEEGIEHLGLQLNRNSLSLGVKTKFKQRRLKEKLKKPLSQDERIYLRHKYKSLGHYKRYVEASKKAGSTIS